MAAGDVLKHFAGRHADRNIGIVLGEPSQGLVDVDLDCDEAVQLADQYLPPTGAITGRTSRPRSHRWYVAPGAQSMRLKDHESGKSIVELRATGAQTVVGPSVHPEGDRYDRLEGSPAHVDPEHLRDCVMRLAEAVQLRRRITAGQMESIESNVEGPARPDVQTASAQLTNGHHARDIDQTKRRAEAYASACPGAISGQGGHNTTYALATALVHGFCLPKQDAMDLLTRVHNPKCEPPWTIKELQHKVEDALSKPHDRPWGWLLDAAPDRPRPAVQIGVHESADDETPGVPGPPRDGPSDPGPFPSELLHPGGFLEDVTSYHERLAHRSQPVLALSGAIALMCVLCGRKVRDEMGNRTNLYLMNVAPTGAGKETARFVNSSILEAAGLGDLLGPEELASDAGLLAAVQERPALLLQIDEIGRFLQSTSDPRAPTHLRGVRTTLMKLFSQAPTTFTGRAYADPSRTHRIVHPCVTLLGTSVPENFYGGLTTDAMTDGFGSRLLVFNAEELPPIKPRVELPPPKNLVRIAQEWGRKRADDEAARNPRTLGPTDTARAVMADLLAEFEKSLRSSTREPERALWARATELARRLMLVHACSLDVHAKSIGVPSVRWAVGLVDYLIRKYLFLADSHLHASPFEARHKLLLRIIRGHGGSIGRSELTRRSQHMSARERDEAIEHLVLAGVLEQQTRATKGRQGHIYVLVRG